MCFAEIINKWLYAHNEFMWNMLLKVLHLFEKKITSCTAVVIHKSGSVYGLLKPFLDVTGLVYGYL